MMKRPVRRLRRTATAIIAVLSLLVVAGCEPRASDPGDPVLDRLAGQPLVSVNGTVYTKLDFYRYNAFVLSELDAEHLTNDQIRDQLIEDYVTHILLLEKARELGLTIEESRMRDIRQNIRDQQGQERIGETMGQAVIDADTLAEQIRERMLTDKLLNEVVGENITVSDRELREYYREVSDDRSRERRAHVLHIVTREQANAELALEELRRGTPFAEVAENYSTGPKRMYGGDLGIISESDYPDFFGAVFSLRPGQFTNIIKSDYGFHIFKLAEFVNAPRRTYEDMKNSLYVELYTRKQEDTAKEYINELHQNAKVEVRSAFSLDEFPHAGTRADNESGDR